MKLFSIPNVLLVLVVMATHEGAHLDGLLTKSQMQWIHSGAKVMMTGQVDADLVKKLTKDFQSKNSTAPKQYASRNYQPYNFVESSSSNGRAEIVPANFSAPASAALPVDMDVNAIVSSVLPDLMGS